MSKMKYINFEKSGIIIFASHIPHVVIAQKFLNEKPISAGFFRVSDNGDIVCYGESIGLNLESDPDDTEIIKGYLRGHREI